MAKEVLANMFHKMGNALDPNDRIGTVTGGAAERALAEQFGYFFPGDPRPVNEPDCPIEPARNTWYLLIDSANTTRGFKYWCVCGYDNSYLWGNYDLVAELEKG